MSVRWVLPSVDPVWRDECLATLHPLVRRRVTVLDNTQANRGVGTSWNLGLLAAQAHGDEWVVLCSEAMRFGDVGGWDLEEQLSSPWTDCGFCWHLMALHMDTVATVGYFDETFWPAYFEDADYERRLELAGYPSPRGTERSRPPVVVDVCEAGVGHAISSGLVSVDLGVQAARYATKWGGPKGEETYVSPYGNLDLSLRAVTLGPTTSQGYDQAVRA